MPLAKKRYILQSFIIGICKFNLICLVVLSFMNGTYLTQWNKDVALLNRDDLRAKYDIKQSSEYFRH